MILRITLNAAAHFVAGLAFGALAVYAYKASRRTVDPASAELGSAAADDPRAAL